MKTKTYKININAPASKVYNMMLGLDNKKTYEAWTALFNPTSTYEGSWKKGCMIAKIAENIPNKFTSIQHYGILENDQEIMDGPKVESWAGGHENYTFTHENGITTVKVDVDVIDDYMDYFNETYPKALEKLK